MAADLSPRPQQVDALAALARANAGHDRVQLVMACGTGKTLVGRWHAQAAAADRTVVFVPSLALVAQLLAEWRRGGSWPFEALVVCSDPTTAAGAAERRFDDGGDADVARPYWATVRAKVTTSPAEAGRFLRSKVDGRPQVVFSTYHSSPVVANAAHAAGIVFDLAVCDEAHRLAGRPRQEFRTVLDDNGIPAGKRLFMTATPLSFPPGDGVVSMDDQAVFGPVAHKVSFRAAIDAGHLADYQVLIVAHDQEVTPSWRPATVPGALLDAIDQHGVRRLLTYHSRVAKAADLAQMFDVTHTPAQTFIRARHVSGRSTAAHRAQTLRWLGDAQPGQVKVVSSARCLTEGIDVPAVDAVMFADPRSSIVDIIQSIGRVLRPAPGKARGSIIIPVALPAGAADDDTELSLSAFGTVWAVLRSLREHDELLARELDEDAAETAAGRHRRRGGDHVQFLLPYRLEQPIRLRIVAEFASGWDRFYAAALDWARGHGGQRIGANATHLGVGVGAWAAKQRTARQQGVLGADRAARLEAIPGWFWDREQANWDDTYAIVERVARDGTVADRLTAPSRFAGMYAVNGSAGPFRLGIWLAMQRQAHRDGMLDPANAARLEQLPGWDWNGGLRDQDAAMVQALKVFGEFEKHADVPDDYVEDGLPLGKWVWAVRRAQYLDGLPPALVDELEAAAPRDVKGMSLWRWERAETEWRWKYAIARRYTEQSGQPPSTTWRTEVDGRDANVGQWCSQQRYKRRHGTLDDQHATWLEALPGWKWDPQLGKPAGDPIDLGDHPHGTAKGAQAKCPCRDCLEYSRANGRRALARKRQLTDPVPAAPAAARLAELEAAGAKRASIAAATRVPLGVIRPLAAGDLDQVERGQADALLAATVEACTAVGADKVGSRGRVASTRHERIDLAPTRALLADLAARGFTNGWVSRELGYARGGLQLTGQTVTRRVADAVADLAARVPADLRAPSTRSAQLPPPLSVLVGDTSERAA